MAIAIQEATAAAAESIDVAEFLFLLIAVLVSAKVLGEAAERIRQPAVVGELLAGVVLGGSVLGIVDPELPILHLLAEVGVVILLFQIGLETDLRRLLAVGPAAALVALAGVVAPFGLGYVTMQLLGFGVLPSVVSGAALTATSVGITARVLSDLGRLADEESQIVLGAAVIDDIVGLIILGVVSQLVAGAAVTPGSVAVTTGLAFGFVAVTLAIGRAVVPRIFAALSRLGHDEALATMALAFAFLVAYVADLSGSALIIGAFTAGIVLQPTPEAAVIEREILALGSFFVPIFFVFVGAAVDVGSFARPEILTTGLLLIVVAMAGKLVAGYVPFWTKTKKSVIGVALAPRGEVGLIFAQMGLASGVLDVGLFSALTMMVLVTTFLAPPLLRILFPPRPGPPREPPKGVAEVTTEA